MLRIVLLALGVFALAQRDAFAYIDPNAGGLLYQLLFPVLIAIAGAWAAFRHKVGYFFSNLVKRFRRR